MHDISFIDGGLSNMKLGDSIIAASMFCHLGKVRWYLKDGDHSDRWVWNKVAKLYKGQFELEMVFEKPGNIRQIHPWRTFADHNMRVVKPSNVPTSEDDDFITTQFLGNFGFRCIHPDHHSKIVEDHGEGKTVRNHDNSRVTLNELFSEVNAAAFHLGCNSGIMWVAAAMGTKTKLIRTDSPHNFTSDSHFAKIIANHSDLIKDVATVPMIEGLSWREVDKNIMKELLEKC